jgi:IS30 family transposase
MGFAMGTHYAQLTEGERCEIFRLHADGISRSRIGCMIGRDKGTISRELRRNALPKSGYLPASAERMALARRQRRRASKIERSSQLLETVRDQLIAMGRSPEQIAGRLELEQGKPVISHESIYRFVYGKAGREEKLHRYLPYAKARRGRRARRGNKSLIPNRISIHDRPAVIAGREQFGHWEGDLMAFSRPGQNNVVLTERKSRYILAARQSNKTAATTTSSLNSLLSTLPEQARRSITFDNGGEFVGHASLGLPTYFCDPHSPWQKGGVENAIGRLRRDLPRPTKPTDHSQADFDDVIEAHNDTPRKCLGFKTPAEAILSEINQPRCT